MGIVINQGPCFACNSSDAGTYYDDGYKCFSCGLSMRNGNSKSHCTELKQEKVQFPENSTTQIGFEGLHWLYKYYMADHMIKKNQIRWDPDTKRVIIPFIVDNELIGYTSRGFDSNTPKYLTRGSSQRKMVLGTGKVLVIVEDAVSGFRLAEVTSTMILNGTYLPREEAEKALVKYDKIVIWLDSDEPGVKASKKIIKLFQELSINLMSKQLWNYDTLNTRIYNVSTEKDPKCYTNQEIMEILNESLINN